MRRRILQVNATILLIVGPAQILMVLAAHLADKGPMRQWVGPSRPDAAIGVVEAFALATLLGVVLLRAAREGGGRFWHVVAASAHTALLLSNLLFWRAFTAAGMAIPGAVATTLHAVLALAEAACAAGGVKSAPR